MPKSMVIYLSEGILKGKDTIYYLGILKLYTVQPFVYIADMIDRYHQFVHRV